MKRTTVLPCTILCLASLTAGACGQDAQSSTPTELTLVEADRYGNAALGDVDNDGDLDLVGANGGAEPDTPLTILRNDGIGRFTHVPESQFETGFGRVTLGDINGDGFLDLFIGWLEQPGPVVLNDGTGGFFDSGTHLDIGDLAGASAVGDLDGDGDLDFFVARYGQGGPNTVWLNQE